MNGAAAYTWCKPAYRSALSLLIAGIVASLLGSALLWYAPVTAARAGTLLPVFMKVPTWVYMLGFPAAVFLASLPRLGWTRAIATLVLGSLVGLGMELLGTSTGWPFGPYAYSGFLGPKVFGLVPAVLPPSWYGVALVAHELARGLSRSTMRRVAIGAVFMVCWDVVLDPAMIAAIPVWDWHVDGPLYGMPWLNLFGWFVTGVVILGGYELILRRQRGAVLPVAQTLWLVSAALPLGLSLLRGMWPAVLVGAVAITLPFVAALRRRAEGRMSPA